MKNDYEIRGNGVAIFISYKGELHETIIDASDFEIANSFSGTWGADFYKKQKLFYVSGKQKNSSVYLHRLLFRNPKGYLVDHINGDTLDNRKENLRLVDKSGNAQNQHRLRPDNKSGYRGVCFHKGAGKWMARVKINGKDKYLGLFDDIDEANEAAKEERAKRMPFSPEYMDRRNLIEQGNQVQRTSSQEL